MANIEMVLDSVRVSLMNYQHVLILKEKEGKRYLPCWIGPAEADAISIKMQDVELARPLTHDSTCAIIHALGGSVESVIIDKLENDTFYAKVMLKSNKKRTEIDCRPSDAVAIAIRVNATIFANEKVLQKAGILIDEKTGKPVGTEVTQGTEAKPKELAEVESQKLERFSEPVRRIFAQAEEQAKCLNSESIDTSHLLLALVSEAPNMATSILTNLGVNLTDIRSAVQAVIDDEQPSETSRVALNDNSKKAIELCVKEATRLGSQQILPEHLLIGIIQEDKGTAGKILRERGISLDRVYAELIRLHS